MVNFLTSLTTFILATPRFSKNGCKVGIEGAASAISSAKMTVGREQWPWREKG